MPKSYLSEEPGALQAAYNRFDPYAQTWNRILSFYDMGHPIDKIEFIILGEAGRPIRGRINGILLRDASKP